MNKSLAFKNKLYLFFSLLISFFIFLYLGYFLINGILSFYKIKNNQLVFQNRLLKLEKQNKFFTDRVRRLQPNTIDLDYLDEQIRGITGFMDKNEITIIFDQ